MKGMPPKAKIVIVLTFSVAAAVLASRSVNVAEDAPGKNPGTVAASGPFRIATDYPSIQAAIDSLEPGVGGTVFIPEGRYRLDKAIDLTRMNYHTQTRAEDQKLSRKSRINTYVHLMGAGNGTILEGTMKEGPVIDMTDCSYCTLSNLKIQSQTADCGILLARPHPKLRNGILLSCGWHTFYNLNIGGRYRVAAVYNQASEVDRWYGCTFSNTMPDAHCFVFSYRNFADIESPYVGETCEVGSNADQRLHGCLFFHHPAKGKGEPQGATIYIQGWAEDFSLTDCDFGTSNVKAAVWIDSTRNPVKQVHLTNNRFENKNEVLLLATGRTFLVDFQGNTCYGASTNYICADTAEYWRIQGNVFGRSDTSHASPLQFAALMRSDVGKNWYLSREDDKAAGTPLVQATQCVETDLVLPTAADFQGSLVRSRLVALSEAGVRREYVGGQTGLLNLTPLDVKTITQPKRGDVALDDGSNTPDKQPAIAIFDGKQWLFR